MDLIPSLLEAPRETLDTLTVPEPVKIGGAEFPIRLVADEYMKNTDQDGVGYCDNWPKTNTDTGGKSLN